MKTLPEIQADFQKQIVDAATTPTDAATTPTDAATTPTDAARLGPAKKPHYSTNNLPTGVATTLPKIIAGPTGFFAMSNGAGRWSAQSGLS